MYKFAFWLFVFILCTSILYLFMHAVIAIAVIIGIVYLLGFLAEKAGY